VEKLFGALPVVAGFSSRLRIRDIVDGACPVRDLAELTHRQVIEALVANRLTSPSPLVHVQRWAREWAVGEALGVDPELLSDDRIGRALDAMAPHLDQIAGSVGVAAIEAFGIDVSRLHWDMSSVSVHGEYAQNEEGFAAPGFGHPKDRRTDLKQVQAGIAVSGDGGIPVFYRAFDGGAGEVGQVIPVMKALQEMATQRRLLIVGDSKLISYANLAAMDSDGVTFVAPASKTYVPAAQLAGPSVEQATRVGYVAQRDQARPADRRGAWHVTDDTMSLAGPRKSDPVLALRRVFVHSSARADAAGKARALKLDRARGDLERLERGLGSRHYPDTGKVEARIAVITSHRRVSATSAPGPEPIPAPGNRPSPGTSTSRRSTPRPPPTAGTPCSPTCPPARPTPLRYSSFTKDLAAQHVVDRLRRAVSLPPGVAVISTVLGQTGITVDQMPSKHGRNLEGITSRAGGANAPV
jgi:hypothetical protein